MNYPERIEQVNLAINDINLDLQARRDDLEAIDDNLVHAVLTATNDDGKLRYTNDKTREIAINDARRVNQAYRGVVAAVRQLEMEKAVQAAKLERLRGEFRLSLIETVRAKALLIEELV